MYQCLLAGRQTTRILHQPVRKHRQRRQLGWHPVERRYCWKHSRARHHENRAHLYVAITGRNRDDQISGIDSILRCEKGRCKSSIVDAGIFIVDEIFKIKNQGLRRLSEIEEMAHIFDVCPTRFQCYKAQLLTFARLRCLQSTSQRGGQIGGPTGRQ